MQIDLTQSLADAIADYAANRPKDQEWCNFFFGSHGCSLPMGDHRVHVCAYGNDLEQKCSEYDEDRPADARIRQWHDEEEGVGHWGEWQAYMDGFRMKD